MKRTHPILFSSPMVTAIFEGRKSQTRRLAGLETINQDPDRWAYVGIDDGYHVFDDKKNKGGGTMLSCRYGEAGHMLWVRETWQAQNLGGKWWHEIKRDERMLHNWAWTNPVRPAYESIPPRWLPGIHMPEIACRLWMPVVGVRAERVQDITEEDAKAEGVLDVCPDGVEDCHFWSHRSSFEKLWNEINGNWRQNPWVWVVEFAG